jgi:hypothetical protein
MRITSLAVILALGLSAATLDAQLRPDTGAATPDARLEARLPAEARAGVRTVIDTARARGLPVEPLIQKALEGASRGANATLIVRAVNSLADRLAAARGALGAASSETELVAAAGALTVGVPNATLRDLRRSQPDRSVALPLVVLADIVQRGVPVDTASSVIMSLSRAGMPEAEFHSLRQAVMQDIGSGANPATAASTRATGILLRVKVTAPPPAVP